MRGTVSLPAPGTLAMWQHSGGDKLITYIGSRYVRVRQMSSGWPKISALKY
jgi:hypothetical protein